MKHLLLLALSTLDIITLEQMEKSSLLGCVPSVMEGNMRNLPAVLDKPGLHGSPLVVVGSWPLPQLCPNKEVMRVMIHGGGVMAMPPTMP